MMVPQLLNCTLSFATMLEEAPAAESDADFISKYCIGLKECRESWTRVRVCKKCGRGPSADAQMLVREADELIAIVTTIVKNKRKNVAAKRAAEKTAKAVSILHSLDHPRHQPGVVRHRVAQPIGRNQPDEGQDRDHP
jgi:four helix bundle protein